MKALILIAFLFSFHSFADCMNHIPESRAAELIAGDPGIVPVTCDMRPADACLCFDGIEWDSAKIENGVLVEDTDKKVAKVAKKQADAAAADARRVVREARRARIQNASPDSANTIAALRAIVKDLVEELKDKGL
jgi:hypothetical protein